MCTFHGFVCCNLHKKKVEKSFHHLRYIRHKRNEQNSVYKSIKINELIKNLISSFDKISFMSGINALVNGPDK